MAMIQFVQNYQDLSTDLGYQFKFHCDKCQNGFMSRFQGSAVGMAGSALRAAGDLLGGFFNSAGNSAFEVQRAVGGKAHDDALNAAVQEGKQFFKQCGRCGKWVCPEVCWNPQAGQCTDCAPKYEQEFAHAHAQAKAQAARVQLDQKAMATDYVSGTDMSAGAVYAAPAMQQPPQMPAAPAPAPQLAAPAGDAAAAAAGVCVKCGTNLGAFKFCPNCGAPRAQAVACKCGAKLVPGMKFCGECGTPAPAG
jgi:hypothetical protein